MLEFFFDMGAELLFVVCGMMLSELFAGITDLKPKRNSTESATLQPTK
jgi:hypothetical protein